MDIAVYVAAGLVGAYAVADIWWRRRARRRLILMLLTRHPVSVRPPPTMLRTDGDLLR